MQNTELEPIKTKVLVEVFIRQLYESGLIDTNTYIIAIGKIKEVEKNVIKK